MCLSIAILRPQHVLAQSEHEGYEFVIVHNDMGFRCGYVRLPVGHPWHGQDYGDIDCRAHGGLTFAEPDMPCDKGGADDAWWIGFDCGHGFDAPDPDLIDRSNEFQSFHRLRSGTVRSQEYVEDECKKICEQAKVAANN